MKASVSGVLVWIAFASGCGGDEKPSPPSDEDQIISVAEQARAATVAQDFATLCELASPRWHEMLADSGQPDCEAQMTSAFAEATAEDRELLEGSQDAAISEVEIDGGTARVRYEDQPGFSELEEEAGQWYVVLSD